MPLGSGALAGNPFNIDRKALADSLDFTRITENSMHAVGDRDFIGKELLELLNTCLLPYNLANRVGGGNSDITLKIGFDKS